MTHLAVSYFAAEAAGYGPEGRMRILRYEPPGLVVKPVVGQAVTGTYGEILTAERMRGRRGIRLHTRTTDPIRIAAHGSAVLDVESELRARGVRIVDCWGCSITPTFAEFEELLDQEPSL